MTERPLRKFPRVIVRNLPWSIRRPEQLVPLFQPYGKVQSVDIPRAQHGKMLGFAFVKYAKMKSAEKAISELNGKNIDGRSIVIDWVVPKDQWENIKDDLHSKTNTTNQEDNQDNKDPLSENLSDMENRDINDSELEDDGESSESEGDEEDVDFDTANMEESLSTESVKAKNPDNLNATLFIRNLPWTTDEDELYEKFRFFGPLKYARIAMESDGRSRGTAFVAFHNESDAKRCLEQYEKLPSDDMKTILKQTDDNESSKEPFTLDGRLLNITLALPKKEAVQRESKKKADKRHLYLLDEGVIRPQDEIFKELSKADISARKQSLDLRRRQLQRNPSIHVSVTRLSVRNIPRQFSLAELRQIGREAPKRYLEELKEGKRTIIKPENTTGNVATTDRNEIIKDLEKLVKSCLVQAKILNDSDGRSKGFGFLEFTCHEAALMALRWLNARPVEAKDETEIKKKRLLVEFAMDDMRKVLKREQKAQAQRERQEKRKRIEEDEEKATELERKEELERKGAAATVGHIIGQKRRRKKLNTDKK